MQVVGIVAEYNPFHTGHLYHIEQSRKLAGNGEPCAVIAVMSGHFVQRGDFAVFSKHVRAEAAAKTPGGPDLIIELPTPFACSSAERFSSAAVYLLDQLGVVSHLSFGSETGELKSLKAVAEYLNTEEFITYLKEELKGGTLYPLARERAVQRGLGEASAVLKTPNNILGVEYLRALQRFQSTITPVTMKRIGTDHDSSFTDGEVASASHIRSMIFNGNAYSAMRYIPEGAIEVFVREMSRGSGPINLAMGDQAVLSHLRRLKPEDFAKLTDVGEGLQYRLFSTLKHASSVEQAADLAKSKRYAHSRIRRILMNAYLGISSDWEARLPPYVKVLAFNETGRELLRLMKAKCRLPIVSKPADAKALWSDNATSTDRIEAPGDHDNTECSVIKDLLEIEELVTDLYMVACPSSEFRIAGHELLTSPVYVRDVS